RGSTGGLDHAPSPAPGPARPHTQLLAGPRVARTVRRPQILVRVGVVVIQIPLRARLDRPMAASTRHLPGLNAGIPPLPELSVGVTVTMRHQIAASLSETALIRRGERGF